MKKLDEIKRFDHIVGSQPRPWLIAVVTVGLLLIMAGTLIPVFSGFNTPFATQPRWFAYIYSAGALLTLIGRSCARYTGSLDRVRRLMRIEWWSALFFCVAAFFLFYEPASSRDWLAFTLAGGAIQIYTSIMIPRTFRKALAAESR